MKHGMVAWHRGALKAFEPRGEWDARTTIFSRIDVMKPKLPEDTRNILE